MNWSEWVLVYLGAGVTVTILNAAWHRQVREELDVIGVLFLWRISLASYVPYKIKAVRAEKARQIRLAKMIHTNKLTLDEARENWGYKG